MSGLLTALTGALRIAADLRRNMGASPGCRSGWQGRAGTEGHGGRRMCWARNHSSRVSSCAAIRKGTVSSAGARWHHKLMMGADHFLALLAVCAAGCWLLNWAVIRRREIGPRRRTPIPLIIVVGWAYAVAPPLAQVIFVGRTDQFSVTDEFSPQAAQVGFVLRLALLVLLILVALHYTAEGGAFDQRVLVIAMVPWGIMLLFALHHGQPVGPLAAVYPILAYAVARARPRLSDFALMGWLTVTTAVGSIALAVFTELGTLRSGPLVDKALLTETTLAGPFPHANTLGVVLVLGAPAVALMRVPWLIRAAGFGVIVWAVVWSSSRTSVAALVAVAALWLALRIVRAPQSRRVVGSLGLVASVIPVIYIPLTTDNWTAYTFRGKLWLASLDHWAQHPWFGSGPEAFRELTAFSARLGGAYHAHNMFVMLLAVGGVAMLTAVGLLLLVAAQRGLAMLQAGHTCPVLFLTAFLASGTLEVTTIFWEPGPQPIMAWLALLAVLYSSAGPAQHDANEPHIIVEGVGGVRSAT